MREHITRMQAIVQGNSSSIQALEAQLGQLASNLSTRPPSSLPCDTENPSSWGKEHCKAITLRSGKQTEKLFLDSTIVPPNTDGVITGANVESEEFVNASNKEVPKIVTHMPNVRPSKLSRQSKMSAKKKLIGIETIALTEGCSVVLKNKLPPKLKDPRSFTIPCSIGNHYLGKALCDLGANINLMSLSTFIKLGIGHMKSTAVTLELVDRSLAQPKGKIKDVLIRMDKFVYPDNFIILYCEADKEEKEECHTIDVLDDLIEEEFNDQSTVLFEELQ
ncbi:uncharacterized protein [Gossypium hirsutum]|uniref:Uncharacterized protein n=1 Tax=Gossypium hirsutum TaxID=3635 RepID=A0ABM3AZJ0_GOSHI|nr:uncharacterized protein LOC121223174 [Gossypium hirsutum]